MTTHRVTFIPGDGTGPELAEATQRVLEATGVEFDWDFQDAGIDVYESEGNPLPDRTLESIRERGLAIKGPTTTPVGSGHRSINVALRKEFDLYACIRPCKAYEGVRTRFPDTDIVIVRENTEDLYAGIEFEKGSPEVEKLRTFLADELDSPTREESGISIKPISVFGSERIVEAAFKYAEENGRKKVVAAHKANIMKFSDGLFLEVARQVAERHPDIEFEDRIIDNLCNQLVSRPEEYDVIVLPNLYGDIVSDLGAGLIGGLGLAPGANIGTEGAIFEATHGSAPKYKGQNKVNPTALMLSGVLMLRHLDETEAADRMEKGIAEVIRKGDKVTYDLKPSRDDPVRSGYQRVRRRCYRGDERLMATTVTVTGAAGQIGYALLFRIASGQMLGPDEKIDLRLLEIPDAVKAAEGTAMELQDCAFPLLASTEIFDDATKAFDGVNVAMLVGARPRSKGMERADLLEANGQIFKPQGEALNAGAADDVKILVVGNPANTNALIAMSNAPDIPGERFTAMTRLDENRAVAQLADKVGVGVEEVEDLAIWGNHSPTMFPDLFNAKVNGQRAVDQVDMDWYENEYIPRVGKRGAEIIDARGASSAASAASAAIDHVRDWVQGADGLRSMAVRSNGEYDVDEGLISSFPLRVSGGSYEIAEGLEVDDFARGKIDATVSELREERDSVRELGLV